MVFQLCCKHFKHNHTGKINTEKTEHILKSLKITLIPKAAGKLMTEKSLRSVTHTGTTSCSGCFHISGCWSWETLLRRYPSACPVILLLTTCGVNILGLLDFGLIRFLILLYLCCVSVVSAIVDACEQTSSRPHAVSSSGQHVLLYVAIHSALQFSGFLGQKLCPLLQCLPKFHQHKHNTRTATHICFVWAT